MPSAIPVSSPVGRASTDALHLSCLFSGRKGIPDALRDPGGGHTLESRRWAHVCAHPTTIGPTFHRFGGVWIRALQRDMPFPAAGELISREGIHRCLPSSRRRPFLR